MEDHHTWPCVRGDGFIGHAQRGPLLHLHGRQASSGVKEKLFFRRLSYHPYGYFSYTTEKRFGYLRLIL